MLANFLILRIAIGCFQEARNKSGRRQLIDNVLMLASAAANGNYGCEMWITLSAPFCVKGGKKVFLTRDGVTAVFSDPRVLIVRCRALKVDVYIVSAHAPYCKSKNDCSEVCD